MELDACDGGIVFPCDAGGTTFPDIDIKNGKTCNVQLNLENTAKNTSSER